MHKVVILSAAKRILAFVFALASAPGLVSETWDYRCPIQPYFAMGGMWFLPYSGASPARHHSGAARISVAVIVIEIGPGFSPDNQSRHQKMGFRGC
jgi:hypothetical protein